MTAPQASPADVARFMRMVDKLPCGCWFWTGARSRGRGNKRWYGSFSYQGVTVRAHRFACEQIEGKMCPPGYHRDHTCHFSLCVNPACIEIVTRQENQERKVRRQSDDRRKRKTVDGRGAGAESAAAAA